MILVPALALYASKGGLELHSYSLPGHGALQLNVPTSWQETVSHPRGDLPPTIEFAPAKGNSFSVQITPLWSVTSDPTFNHPDKIRPLVETIGRKQLEQSVETEVTLNEIKGVEARGYFFTVTDKAPKEEEWKFLTAGAVGVGDLLVSFTILTNSLDAERDQALQIIGAVRQVAGRTLEPEPQPSQSVTPKPSHS